ncbi:MAG TPA: transglutaminase-like domain-containing protein [Caldilineaceae bacterium]|nr:transglutaminase-like domain-containing protein [Caldilineaceae bacterium]
MDFLSSFRRELQKQAPAPERLAFYIAGMAYPMLDVEEEMARLDAITALVSRALTPIDAGYERAMRFLDVLYYDLGFVGNRENYYEPNNSFFNIVLQQRTGLPIMLSMLYMVVGQRLNLDVTGMGFPGHFMVRYREGNSSWLLDPFHGKLMAEDEVNSYLSDLFGQPVYLPLASFTPVAPSELAQRILNNLRNVYLGHRAFTMALRVTDYLLAIDPLDRNIWRERGLLHYQEDHWEAASYSLRRYFYLSGQLMVAHGLSETERAEPISHPLPADDEQVLEIFFQIEEMRKRIN